MKKIAISRLNKILIIGLIIVAIVCSPAMAISRSDLLTYSRSEPVSAGIADNMDDRFSRIHDKTRITSGIQDRIGSALQTGSTRADAGSPGIVPGSPAVSSQGEPFGEIHWYQALYHDPSSGLSLIGGIDDAGNIHSRPVRWIPVQV